MKFLPPTKYEKPLTYFFTLIELLVCITIIMILMTILLPILNKTKLQAKKITCISNLKQIGQVFCYYEGDYNRWPAIRKPTYWMVRLWYVTYSKSYYNSWKDGSMRNTIWTCPSYGDYHPTEYSLIGYGMLCFLPPLKSGDGWSLIEKSCPIPTRIKKPSITVLAGDSSGLYNPHGAGYGDWHLGVGGNYSMNNIYGYVHLGNANMLFSDMHAESNRKAQYFDYFSQTDLVSTGSY